MKKSVYHSLEGGNMNSSNSAQKKKTIMNYVYATLVGLLVVACAVTIALVNSTNTITRTEGEIGGEDIQVSTNSYVSPMKNATVVKDYSNKELQYNDTLNQWEIHKAIDFLSGEDSNVYAVANGKVTNVYTNYLEGSVIEISHDNGLVSIYKSLSSTAVKIGDSVSAGDVIGEVGTSMAQELNSGAHLHFEMMLNGKLVDPNNYLDLGAK